MTLQFFGIEPNLFDSCAGRLSECSKSSLLVPDESMVAFSAIHTAATDPSTLPENEVCSIDKLICAGVTLYAPTNESFAHHLPRSLLEDAMIEFTRLTPDGFVAMVLNCSIAELYSELNNDSPDVILRELSDPTSTLQEHLSPKLETTDWLKQFHWDIICEFRGFVADALRMNLEVLRNVVST